MKKAILMASFGTRYRHTRNAAVGGVEEAVARAYPDWEVRRAFTSNMIIERIKRRDGVAIDNVSQALERLLADGFEEVTCQPTHLINGYEYDDLAAVVTEYASRFHILRLGTPLLTATADYEAVVSAVRKAFHVPKDTALVLMGHGTRHFANCAYAALNYHFQQHGMENIFVGALEGYPDLNALFPQVNRLGAPHILLAPFMLVAGDHAVHDMASDEETSWKSQLISAGYHVDCLIKGLGECEEIQQIYISHVAQAVPVNITSPQRILFA